MYLNERNFYQFMRLGCFPIYQVCPIVGLLMNENLNNIKQI